MKNTFKPDVGLEAHPVPEIRDAHDAANHNVLASDPTDEQAVADIASDESFPASDPPSHTIAGGGEPAPSSGYDEQAERRLVGEKDEEPIDVGADPWVEGP